MFGCTLLEILALMLHRFAISLLRPLVYSRACFQTHKSGFMPRFTNITLTCGLDVEIAGHQCGKSFPGVTSTNSQVARDIISNAFLQIAAQRINRLCRLRATPPIVAVTRMMPQCNCCSWHHKQDHLDSTRPTPIQRTIPLHGTTAHF